MSLMRIASLIFLIMISGCQYVSVQSSQLSAVISAFRSDSEEFVGYQWAVQYGGYLAAVQPVMAAPSTVFVNDIDAVSFDGWLVTKVSGLNSFTPAWEIYDSGNQRSFSVNGQVMATHQCDTWLKKNAESGVRFEQHCSGQSAYTNTILVDNLGQITDIAQVVDSTLMVLRLKFHK